MNLPSTRLSLVQSKMVILSVLALASQRFGVCAAFQLNSLRCSSCSGKALAVSASDWTTRGMSSSTKEEDEPVLDPLIVCGPSGVGKGTIIERFMSEEFGGNLHFGFTTSHTTRNPRPGEIDKVHYNFVTKPEMKTLMEQGKFIENAEVHGNFYGTSWESLREVQRSGKRPLLDIDVQGVKNIKSVEQVNNDLLKSGKPSRFQPKFIFIAPVDFESLKERLTGRGTESAESLAKRTKNAKEEVEFGMQEGNFDYVLVNDDLEEACREFTTVVKKMYGIS